MPAVSRVMDDDLSRVVTGTTPYQWLDNPLHCFSLGLSGDRDAAHELPSGLECEETRTDSSKLPIDIARTEEMKQAIRDEPRRRMDHGRP